MNKQLKWDALGFPVVLVNFPTKTVRGVEVPDVNMKSIQEEAFRKLVSWPHRFTGRQLKFIRSYLQETQVELAQNINASHSSVSLWEDALDKPTRMEVNTELILRFHMLHSLTSPSFRNSKVVDLQWRQLVQQFAQISENATKKLKPTKSPIHIEHAS
jgi:DNA-binding transcriptional regulator YiaG